MREEETFKKVLQEYLKREEVNLFDILRFGLLSLSRQFSIYLFNIGRRVGKFYSIEKTGDVKKVMEALKKVLKRMGIHCEMESYDKKYILKMKKPVEDINCLFFERGIIQGFLEESLKDLNVFTKEEGEKIIVEVCGEEELIRRILGR